MTEFAWFALAIAIILFNLFDHTDYDNHRRIEAQKKNRIFK